ncbi:site-specific integrase [Pseudomonas nabeulensis]|uniref:Site-specific integrase n=1 Tax=Pseudomonas nabeulensis TaxID=2293833 RepID=A0A4Z0B8B8_9PSED|nr:site-specific integrase [Pseudomonas nabeulensis]TFY94554.1 site-specific integrase [Pseudomonas nabeulensis]
MSTVPSYLLLSRHSVYYFRIVVPDVIRPLFPQREIRRSLQTRCKREALIRGRDILAQVQGLFTQAFQGSRPSVELLRGAWEAGGKRLACWASWLRQQQLLGVAMPSPEALRETPPVAVHASIAPSSVIAKGSAQQSPGFLAVVDEQLVQQRREGVAVKSLDDKRAVAVLLTRIIGDMPIDQITRKDAHLFRETALKLPPRLYQLPDQPLEQSIAEATTTISVTTFNNYVKNLTTFFSYAVREGYCSRNPFDGLRVRIRRKVSEERSAFSAEDLKALFHTATYAPAHGGKPNQYWLPLLGLYTGARLNELCQLYTDDVVTIDGIACIHIRATRPDQKLKTPSSERLVPIHSKLLALGFLEYVTKVKEAGNERVFSELTCHKKHGYSAAPSKWFTRVREQLGFRDDSSKKDFHSFRHTLADHLKQKGIAEALVGGVLGHQAGGITFGRYGKDFRPDVLAPVIELVTLESF